MHTNKNQSLWGHLFHATGVIFRTLWQAITTVFNACVWCIGTVWNILLTLTAGSYELIRSVLLFALWVWALFLGTILACSIAFFLVLTGLKHIGAQEIAASVHEESQSLIRDLSRRIDEQARTDFLLLPSDQYAYRLSAQTYTPDTFTFTLVTHTSFDMPPEYLRIEPDMIRSDGWVKISGIHEKQLHYLLRQIPSRAVVQWQGNTLPDTKIMQRIEGVLRSAGVIFLKNPSLPFPEMEETEQQNTLPTQPEDALTEA